MFTFAYLSHADSWVKAGLFVNWSFRQAVSHRALSVMVVMLTFGSVGQNYDNETHFVKKMSLFHVSSRAVVEKLITVLQPL